RLKEIDRSRALNIPGVLAVLTHKDIKGTNRQGVVRKDQPVLVDDKARHYGDPVALVLVENKALLPEALDQVAVFWEPLPPVYDPEEALKEQAPLIHEDHPEGNCLLKGEIVKGLGRDGFSGCTATVRAAFAFSRQEHAYLETENGWAVSNENGFLEMAVSTQTPFRDRAEVAEALGLDQEKIRVIAPCCGGAFGGKDGITVQSLLALGAIHCPGRPVKMYWEREESFLAGCKRHPARLEYRLGAGQDGTFQALEARIIFDTGPYDHLGGAVLTLGLEHAGGPYRVPHVYLQGQVIYTNNPVSGAFRGFGVPQVTGALEQMVDLLAEKMGLSPLEIRRRNALQKGDKNSVGVRLTTSTGLKECLDRVEAHPVWQESLSWQEAARPGTRRGAGLSCVHHAMGYGPVIPDTARAKIELTGEGKFRIYCGVVDMGQGNSDTFLQIAGDLLNQARADLELVLPDTAQTLPSGSASASRTTYTFGQALIKGLQEMKQRLLVKAQTRIKTGRLDELILEPGRIRHTSSGQTLDLRDLALDIRETERIVIHEFKAPVSEERVTPDTRLQLHGLPHLIFSYGVHLVYLEIDELTGRVEVKKYLAINDCGRLINPQLFEQQIQGGIAQGLGYALFEDFKVDQGMTITTGLSTYILPSAMDVPDMEVEALGLPEESGPFGLKGCGELAMDGPLAAVANALAAAVGRRIYESPLTAERVLKALEEGRRKVEFKKMRRTGEENRN
ncbi:MAG: xanthine dehydrogenase family protein molybdopterin-binding subunit, partial [Thermodesulfobacteriota bacterium]